LQKDVILNHPGACSLEFQSVMQILMECMLQWDVTKKSTKGRGILGTVVAFSAADEEQGRKTLHCLWQKWVKEINQMVQHCLFHEDSTIRDRARKTFCKQINNVITASYGAELIITHNRLNENNDVVHKQETVQNIFQEQDPCTFRCACHKELCTEIQGGLMSCSDCGKIISTSEIINSCLQQWRDTVIPNNKLQDNRPDTTILHSKERLDMAAYTFTYHMENSCALEKDCFRGNKHVQELLLKYKFEEHSACHKASCFKKGCEYRFFFPFMSTTSTYIHEDKGVQNENEIL
jgi:hypothetical protein